MASTINAKTTGVGGIDVSGDASGVLALQTGGTTALTIDASQNVTLANTLNVPNTFAFKNRIINGGMVIDQRNAGASVTPNNVYTLDRWYINNSQTGKLTVQQNAGSVTLPVGFSNYLGVTSSSAYSVLTGDIFALQQLIEGFNFADMAWGTANASAITLSFRVRSSLTGTFGGSLTNSANSRSYPFSYSIPVANTWTTISVTIAGDTTGTWIGATNGVGVKIWFNLGSGATYSGTAGSWSGPTYTSATGAVSVVGTSGATFYITGVQLEKGSVATSFDQRDYGRELIMCQRYYLQRSYGNTQVQASTSDIGGRSGISWFIPFPVSMRATPTIISSYSSLGNATGNGLAVFENFIQAGISSITAGGYAGVFNFSSASAEL